MIVYKYRSGRGSKDSEGRDIFERDLELLSKNSIYIPTSEQLNDPAEALVDVNDFKAILSFCKVFGVNDSIKNVEDQFSKFYNGIRSAGIYSLSKKNDNELMWAYYASGHTGYAIIFDTDVLSKSFGHVQFGGMYEFDVNYSNKLPQFDITKIGKEDIVKTLSCFLGNKSKAWEHEAEHRLVFDKGGRCLKIDYRAIKGFVFGYRMEEEDIDYVMNLFSGRGLEYYKVKRKDNSYKLFKERLADKNPNATLYSPNHVEYDIEELLKNDKFIGGSGYKYRQFVEQALCVVSREPFVMGISHIVVTDDQKWPHIMIWTEWNQEGSFRKMRSFEYNVIGDTLVRAN